MCKDAQIRTRTWRMKLIVGLKERGVLRVATGYLGASWLVIEIGHTLFNVFELPHMPLQLVAILLVLGFRWHSLGRGITGPPFLTRPLAKAEVTRPPDTRAQVITW